MATVALRRSDVPAGTATCACGKTRALDPLDATDDKGAPLYAFPSGWAFAMTPTGPRWACSTACLEQANPPRPTA